VSMPVPSMGESPPPDPKYSCTCCRQVLIRETLTVYDASGPAWEVLMCPECDSVPTALEDAGG
jgi:hypothetical protein